ncbi:MAG: amidophosphoribosyltransferase [Limnochordaceae bacterium]|nr:amidophosphoribosyltransferase [Limnochordaceae bacterium]
MCGVFGICAQQSEESRLDAAHLTYLGLFALQHRGQESAGLAVATVERPTNLLLHKEMGLVSEVFTREVLAGLPGGAAIGHVRYSTTGASCRENAQPLLSITSHGPVAVAHNGNLVNATALRKRLLAAGALFQTSTDTELLLALIAQSAADDLTAAVAQALAAVRGAYALAILGRNPQGEPLLIGARDPYGFRPLVVGRRPDAYVLASESCALAAVGATVVAELEPGQAAIMTPAGLRLETWFPARPRSLCVFEYIYIARPDSELEYGSVHRVRQEIGRQLARESPVEADVVIPAPDSGTSAALGYSLGSGIPFDLGLIKNRYMGRTFIQPDESERELGVRIKLNPVRAVLAGQRVVVVDDSIVRGTTSRKTVRLLREAGAKEVHLMISSPPYRHACYYGVDTSDEEKLIARHHSVEEIRQLIGADSLHFLSVEGLLEAVGRGATAFGHTEGAAAAGSPGRSEPGQGVGQVPFGLCTACFSGQYPTELPARGRPRKDDLEGRKQNGQQLREPEPDREPEGTADGDVVDPRIDSQPLVS